MRKGGYREEKNEVYCVEPEEKEEELIFLLVLLLLEAMHQSHLVLFFSSYI